MFILVIVKLSLFERIDMTSVFLIPKASLISLLLIVGCAGDEKNSAVQTDDQDSQGVDLSVITNDSQPSQDSTEDSGDVFEDSTEINDGLPAKYCENNNPELANCDQDTNYDPWIAGTGEVHYWIRDQKTEVFPFTTDDHQDLWYGYLQLTSPRGCTSSNRRHLSRLVFRGSQWASHRWRRV